MKKQIARFLAGLTLFYATAALAKPAGSSYSAWYPGDENITVDAKGIGWQECIGRGCKNEYTKVGGVLAKPGVFKASNGYYYCKYPTEDTRNHANGKCTLDGWKF